MATGNELNVFTSEIAQYKDIAKNYLFQVTILPMGDGTPLAQMLGNGTGSFASMFTFRCRGAALPGRTIDGEIESNWQGTKLVYPGRTKMDGEITFKFDEFEDGNTGHMIHSWMNLIHNGNIGMDGEDIGARMSGQYSGAAASNYIGDYAAKIRISCIGSTHDITNVGKEWVLYYAWPKDMPQADLDQAGSDKLERSVTIRYSTYQEVSAEKSE